jgi:DNA polymerase-3 subunit alpha
LRLKAGAPAAFLAAALTQAAEQGDRAARAVRLAEAPLLGVGFLPPDVDRSGAAFAVEAIPGAAPAVRWGLLGVPGWTAPAAAALVAARAAAPDGQFADLEALCAALDPRLVSRLALDSLIRVGACDRWGNRGALLAALDGALGRAAVASQAAQAGTAQLDLFALPASPPDTAPAAPEPDSPAPESPKPHSALRNPQSPADWRRWEEDLLGLAFTAPPDLDGPSGGRGGPVADLRQIGPAQRGTSVTLPVVLAAVRVVAAPDGGQMALARAEDAAGMLPLVIFPDVYGRSAALCTPGSAVIVTARVQQAEAGAGGGSPVILVATRLAPYKLDERGPSLDVTPVARRAPAARAPRQAPDPTEFSKTGARYYRAPRAEALPEPPPDLPEPPIEAYEDGAESAAPAEFAPPPAAPPVAAPPPIASHPAEPVAAPAPATILTPQSALRNPQVRITLLPLADESAEAARLHELRAILRRFPGDTPVTLVFPADTPGAPAEELPLKYGVASTPDLHAAVTALLDPTCLAVE